MIAPSIAIDLDEVTAYNIKAIESNVEISLVEDQKTEKSVEEVDYQVELEKSKSDKKKTDSEPVAEPSKE